MGNVIPLPVSLQELSQRANSGLRLVTLIAFPYFLRFPNTGFLLGGVSYGKVYALSRISLGRPVLPFVSMWFWYSLASGLKVPVGMGFLGPWSPCEFKPG